MPMPTLAKTWQFSINQQTANSGSVETNTDTAFLLIKNALKAFGSGAWTVVGSSNGTTAGIDGVDRLSTIADIVHNNAASAHSWIVLKNTGLGSNFQVLFAFDSSNPYQWTIITSPSAGFTGGSITANPTTTDGFTHLSVGSFWPSSAAALVSHTMVSTDGECTRVVVYSANAVVGGLFFEKAQNPSTGWTIPVWCRVAVGSTSLNVTSWASVASNYGSRAGSTNFTGFFLSEGTNAGLAYSTTDVGTVANQLDSTWPLFPFGLCSQTPGVKGRHGNVYDLWCRPSGVAVADTFPNDPALRRLVAFGELVFPWTNGADVPLTL